MYRRPKFLDERIPDQVFERLMDIASEECDNFMCFGGPQDRFEKAVLHAANVVVKSMLPPAAKVQTSFGHLAAGEKR